MILDRGSLAGDEFNVAAAPARVAALLIELVVDAPLLDLGEDADPPGMVLAALGRVQPAGREHALRRFIVQQR